MGTIQILRTTETTYTENLQYIEPRHKQDHTVLNPCLIVHQECKQLLVHE
jgi:hypothetical protein